MYIFELLFTRWSSVALDSPEVLAAMNKASYGWVARNIGTVTPQAAVSDGADPIPNNVFFKITKRRKQGDSNERISYTQCQALCYFSSK